jgi:uncharacterized protein (DUF433 family)
MSSACYLSSTLGADGHARIERDASVMAGKPVVRGTRITVELILRELAAGKTACEIVESYPRLTEDDVRSALTYAADVVCSQAQVRA